MKALVLLSRYPESSSFDKNWVFRVTSRFSYLRWNPVALPSVLAFTLATAYWPWTIFRSRILTVSESFPFCSILARIRFWPFSRVKSMRRSVNAVVASRALTLKSWRQLATATATTEVLKRLTMSSSTVSKIACLICKKSLIQWFVNSSPIVRFCTKSWKKLSHVKLRLFWSRKLSTKSTRVMQFLIAPAQSLSKKWQNLETDRFLLIVPIMIAFLQVCDVVLVLFWLFKR